MTITFLMQSIRNVFSCRLVEKCSSKGYGTKVEVKLIDGNLWLAQEQIVSLYNSSKSNISEHIKHILEEGGVDPRGNCLEIPNCSKGRRARSWKKHCLYPPRKPGQDKLSSVTPRTRLDSFHPWFGMA